MDIYSHHEGEETLERGKAPLLPYSLFPCKGKGTSGFPEKSVIFLGAEGDRLLNTVNNGEYSQTHLFKL